MTPAVFLICCMLCGAECKSVVHVLWECSTYSNCRDNFQEALKQV